MPSRTRCDIEPDDGSVTCELPESAVRRKFAAMTVLVASQPPILPDEERPGPGAAALALLLHVAVALLIVVAARYMPAAPTAVAPEEQTVAVVFMPPASEFEPLNFDENAEIGQETTIQATGEPEPAPSGDPAAAPAPGPQQPDRRAVPPEPAQPAQAMAQPSPPAAAATAPEAVQQEPAPRELPAPTQPVIPAQTADRAAPPQVAAVPPPRPQVVRPPQRPAEPTPPTQPRQRGELNDLDLFGRNRLPAQQAARAPARAPTGARTMTTEGVFLLRQVLRVWNVNWRDPRFQDVGFSFRMVLQADGTLAHPWGRNDPWSPRLLIDNYDELLQPGQEQVRRLAESFAYALKMGQPYNLPPTPGPYPRPVALTFRMGDL